MEKHLHIVSFNIPFPADYGGVIDIYYKIKSLYDAGIRVHLHAFHYGRQQARELEAICSEVSYYPRAKFFQAIYSSVPYIVGSRKSDDLLSSLLADDYPVLFEGLHTCFYLNHPALRSRFKIVRMHNIEWDYYNSLGKAERNFFRKFYLYSESRKLKEYEEILHHASLILAISPADTEYLMQKFQNVHYIPAFHPFSEVLSQTGTGKYALYHGNLSVPENNQAAFYLINKVFDDIDFPLRIAGKEPRPSLKNEVFTKGPRFELIPNPYDEGMFRMIREAQMNVLPTFQPTGIKLKLLNSLFNGRHCVVNSPMVRNTGLESLCIVADNAAQMKEAVLGLKEEPFTEEMIEKRRKLLYQKFSNQANAAKLIGLIPFRVR
ncbi:MAG: hypothetical protein KatS3mg031_0358 [Chitinophagales bacterium]|nr:MAG: hypothetical protein KatS3mg031_0358 [Chitinophagales bacterium]